MGDFGYLNGKPWRCKKGHILGAAVREGKMTRLYVFREALDVMASVETISIGEGSAGMIMESGLVQCSLCGRSRRWIPGETALRRMLSRYPGAVEKFEELKDETA